VAARFCVQLVQLKVMCSRYLPIFESLLPVELHEESLVGLAINIPLAPEEEAFTITDGREMGLGKVARQYVGLEVTLKPLCHPRYTKLCPRCERNLNHDKCVYSLVESGA